MATSFLVISRDDSNISRQPNIPNASRVVITNETLRTLQRAREQRRQLREEAEIQEREQQARQQREDDERQVRERLAEQQRREDLQQPKSKNKRTSGKAFEEAFKNNLKKRKK